MITWTIRTEKKEIEIQLGKTTLFLGEHESWYYIIRDIEQFFTNKNSNIEIYEDTQLLTPKDWDVLWIPYDAHLQLDKILAKSPLMPVMNNILQFLEYSPFYQNIVEGFEELKEEQVIINQLIQNYDLQVELRDFTLNDMKGFIQLNTCAEKSSPVDTKQLLLNLFSEKVRERKTLILIELPELFANFNQLIKFRDKLLHLNSQGVMVIILTNHTIFQGQKNYMINEQIINDILFQKLFKEIKSIAPFVFDKLEYNKAVDYIKMIVDNYPHSLQNQNEIDCYPQDIATLILMIKQRVIPSFKIVEPKFPINIQNFLKANS